MQADYDLYTIARYFMAASISVLTWDSMAFMHNSTMSFHDVGISAGLSIPKDMYKDIAKDIYTYTHARARAQIHITKIVMNL